MTVTDKPTGLYSEQAAERFGTVFWLDEQGVEREITAYSRPSKYKWPDTVVVGPVTKYVRQGRPGYMPSYLR